MIYHGTFISDGNNCFNGKYEISVPMEQIFRGSRYFVTGLGGLGPGISFQIKKNCIILNYYLLKNYATHVNAFAC